MPIAATRSSADVRAKPFFQNTWMARRCPTSLSNSLGRATASTMAVLERIVKNVDNCNAGRFGAVDIRASRFVIEASHHVADAVWSPRLGLVLDVASGDKNPADPDLQTFNALFQSGTYSGRAQLLGPSNSIRLEPSVMLAPARDVLVSAGWGFYWRQSAYDALYSISGQVIVPSNGVTDRYEGSRPTVHAWTTPGSTPLTNWRPPCGTAGTCQRGCPRWPVVR